MKMNKTFLSALVLFVLCLANGCKKETLSPSFSNALRDGRTWSAETHANTTQNNRINLSISSSQDEYFNSLLISLRNLPQGAFRHDFTSSDEGINFSVKLYASQGGDAGCGWYSLDTGVTTNFFEVSYFSLEDCTIRGSYDLTFKTDEEGENNCANPTYGPVIRFTEGSFEAAIDDCG